MIAKNPLWLCIVRIIVRTFHSYFSCPEQHRHNLQQITTTRHVLSGAEKRLVIKAHECFCAQADLGESTEKDWVRNQVAKCLVFFSATFARVFAYWKKLHDRNFAVPMTNASIGVKGRSRSESKNYPEILRAIISKRKKTTHPLLRNFCGGWFKKSHKSDYAHAPLLLSWKDCDSGLCAERRETSLPSLAVSSPIAPLTPKSRSPTVRSRKTCLFQRST